MTAPECYMCGTDKGPLRIERTCLFTGKHDYTCEDCYVPQQSGGDGYGGKCCGVLDGPGWDDLEKAE